MMRAFAEKTLLVIGLVCLGYYGLASADSAYRQREARVAVERLLVSADRDSPAENETAPSDIDEPVLTTPETAAAVTLVAKTPETTARAATARVAGREARGLPVDALALLEIPRLKFSTPVLEGDDADTLRGAAGHLPDTPHPWEYGNSAIAAHRDGIFRPLRHIKVGDELLVQTARGELRYRVSDTHIVKPTDLSVLEAKSRQMLTLITCYPFNYVGAAPKRFIVHAERIE